MKPTILLVAFAAMTFAACKKEKQNVNPEEKKDERYKSYRITSITEQNNNQDGYREKAFKYNNDGSVSAIASNSYDASGSKTEHGIISFTYHTNGLLSKEVKNYKYNITSGSYYYKDNGQLDRIDYYYTEGHTIYQTGYTYKSGKVTNKLSIIDGTDTLYTTNYEYDNKGNVTLAKTVSTYYPTAGSNMQLYSNITYSDKPNPLLLLKGIEHVENLFNSWQMAYSQNCVTGYNNTTITNTYNDVGLVTSSDNGEMTIKYTYEKVQ